MSGSYALALKGYKKILSLNSSEVKAMLLIVTAVLIAAFNDARENINNKIRHIMKHYITYITEKIAYNLINILILFLFFYLCQQHHCSGNLVNCYIRYSYMIYIHRSIYI